ncbi:hypothetical protein TGGT1_411510 [Toxoplasma gondii GT1]|uniref:Uncharacterized protein n=1 Tax=Toxoplasma gondii (strain ATCC 50853 / GT1) TaxID=507601 RepID=S7UF08_TOXGG|nr:hypothetical protein TGGT1_411510 [Toxoplasma gondii GT1]
MGCVGQSSCGSERSEFTRFGIRRLWRVAVPHGPAFFPYDSRRSVRDIVGRFLQAAEVVPRGPSALWHELSTFGVWRPLMGRLSLCEIVGRFVQALNVREEEIPGACSVPWCNCRTT